MVCVYVFMSYEKTSAVDRRNREPNCEIVMNLLLVIHVSSFKIYLFKINPSSFPIYVYGDIEQIWYHAVDRMIIQFIDPIIDWLHVSCDFSNSDRFSRLRCEKVYISD